MPSFSRRIGGTLRAAVASMFVAALSNALAVAQCTPFWLPGQAFPGVNGAVTAMVPWDPDGPGPAQPRLAVAGSFTIAGDVRVPGLAAYDAISRSWAPIGTVSQPSSFGPLITELAAAPNGDLFLGGSFTSIDGVTARRLARWNGSAWQEVGGGLNTPPQALAVLPSGALVVAGGGLAPIGGSVSSPALVWDGVAWTAIGAGLQVNMLRTVVARANGDVVAIGIFQSGATTTEPALRWNGATWQPLGTGLDAYGYAATAAPNGDLLVAGYFPTATGTARVARWDGSNWTLFMPPAAWSSWYWTEVADIVAESNGAFAVGGLTIAGGNPFVGRFDGTNWQTLGAAFFGTAAALAQLPNGQLVIGGNLSPTLPTTRNIAVWDGANWTAPNDGTIGSVLSIARLPNGDRVVGGGFTAFGGIPARNVARFDGSSWQSLATGLDGLVRALLPLANGEIVAGGQLLTPWLVARWNGTAWVGLGVGPSGNSVDALLELPGGDLLAGSSAGVFRWNGAVWSPTGATAAVNTLYRATDGSIYAGADNGVLRWNGTGQWNAVGWTFGGSVQRLGQLADGTLVAAGSFSSAGGVLGSTIARWNGTLWLPFGGGISGPANDLLLLPDGDLVLAGGMQLANGSARLARWNGSTWSRFGGDAVDATAQVVHALANGDLLVGGGFSLAGGGVSVALAQLSTPCPATALPFGAGCSGTGGQNVLTATSLPWLGAPVRSRATGQPSNGLALGVLGVSATALPLASLLPMAGPTCSLYAAPDLTFLLVPTGGVTEWTWTAPSAPTLVGQTLFQQVLGLDLASGALAAVTSTNRLTLTLGAL